MSLMTSSIFCAASASPAMSALVDCASAVAARTTSVARASWWLISAIDFDISSAALAAISTLSNASPDVLTAPAVCVCGVVGDRRQRRRGRLHRRDTVADGRQYAFDAFAEPGDGFFDDGAAGFLGAEQGVFLLHLAALGDVVVGSDPVRAAGYGAVDDRNGAAVGQFGARS